MLSFPKPRKLLLSETLLGGGGGGADTIFEDSWPRKLRWSKFNETPSYYTNKESCLLFVFFRNTLGMK